MYFSLLLFVIHSLRCDHRMSVLAYTLKHWCKSRRVNNASEGTLSSYGYLLCLVHYLQTRQPHPVLPCLQALPPDWSLNDDEEGESGRKKSQQHQQPQPRSQHQGKPPPSAGSKLPNIFVAHPVDGRPVDTYFYVPPNGDFTDLQRFGARNTSSVRKKNKGVDTRSSTAQ
jgi:terminal uridylyltransferase